jgi:CMP-N,N'-diacetyllegionaminic acid synthase
LKYLGLIPARGGSKGIPGKNLVDVAGRPLIAYTFEAALRSKRLDRVILSTDDQAIAAAGRQYGIDVPFLRPPELAKDDSVLEDVMAHALSHLKKDGGYTPDAMVLLQPTSPLRRAGQIDAAIGLFEKEGVESLVSVSPPMEHPCDMAYFERKRMRMLFEKEGFLAGKQRQEYPEFLFINGAIYVFRVETLLARKSRFGDTVVPFLMPQLDSIDVDSEADLRIAELILKERAEK